MREIRIELSGGTATDHLPINSAAFVTALHEALNILAADLYERSGGDYVRARAVTGNLVLTETMRADAGLGA